MDPNTDHNSRCLVLNMEPLPRKVGWNKKNKKAPEEGEKKEAEPAADKDEEMKTP